MNNKGLAGTLLSKILILAVNFAIVTTTTQLWGSEGRGIISIITADVAIIAILNNILGGSSVVYFIPKTGFEILMIPAYCWIAAFSALGTIFFYLLQPISDVWFLLLLSLLNSLFAVNLLYFTARQKFKYFNLFSLALPVLCFGLICFNEFVLKIHSYKSYFWGFSTALFILYLLSLLLIMKSITIKKIGISIEVIKTALRFGWQIELSSLLHFINYRIAYFLILYYNGINSVGIYSIGIALAESVWVISRSFSTVQYSGIINNRAIAEHITKIYASLNLMLTFLAVLVLVMVPNSWYQAIFGRDFSQVRLVMLCLFPGIVSMAISNTYGHYFSALGMPKILITKSGLGLVFTLVLSPLLLPRFGLLGACVTTSISYLSSSIYLIIMFYKQVKFRYSDFVPQLRELRNIKL